MKAQIFHSPQPALAVAEIDVSVVTQELLQAFIHGELSPPEEEAMAAFLDDFPEIRREISGWPRRPAVAGNGR